MTKEEHRLNCWEFQECGRETGGANVAVCGVCPVTEEKRLDGVHCGKNAGRACWAVAGTSCEGRAEGSFAKKYRICSLCDFYRLVREEEKPGNIIPTYTLLKILEAFEM